MQSRSYNKDQLATAQGWNTSALLRFTMVRNYTMSDIFIIWRANTASRLISRKSNKKHTQYILLKQGTLYVLGGWKTCYLNLGLVTSRF